MRTSHRSPRARRPLAVLLALAAGAAALGVTAGAEEPKQPAKPDPSSAAALVKRMPLIELFTSQG